MVQIIEHIEKVSAIRNCSFLSAASDIFGAKISGTFKRYILELDALIHIVNTV